MEEPPKKPRKKKEENKENKPLYPPLPDPQTNACAVIAVVRMSHILLPLIANHLMIGPASMMTPDLIRQRVPDFWLVKRMDVFTVPVKQLIHILNMAGVYEQPVNG